MRRLYVLYDERCGFCRRCAAWLREQPTFVPLTLLGRGSDEARRRFGPLLDRAGDDEMLAVGDDGSVYRETGAYLMCLWALRRHRAWSYRLARPALRPLVRGAFQMLARNRRRISRLLSHDDDTTVAAALRCREPLRCATDPGGARWPIDLSASRADGGHP